MSASDSPLLDALRPAPDASYDAQIERPPMDTVDVARAAAMIGRPLRGESAVAVRCGWGMPAVLRVAPHLGDGTPFPTMFWLSCPLASKEVGRIEASGVMQDLNRRLQEEPELGAEYAAASDRYVAARNRLGDAVPRDDSAGGMPVRVKCLHTLYAHHLATRDNPIGEWVAERVEPMPCPAPCVSVDDAGAQAAEGGSAQRTGAQAAEGGSAQRTGAQAAEGGTAP